MKTVEAFHKEYEVVGGNREILVPGARIQLADLHLHSKIDSHATPRRILQAAARDEIDVVALTEHNLWTPANQEEALGIARRIRDEQHLELEVVAASEAAVLPVLDKHDPKGKHVLIFNQKKPLASFMRWEDLRREADDQEALLVIAHPGLSDFSYGRDDVSWMIDKGLAPDGFEGQNGSAALLDTNRRVMNILHRLPFVPHSLRSSIPHPGTNEAARELYDEFQTEITGITGGSDAHEARRVGEAVTVFPVGTTVFEALREGQVAVAQRKKLAPLQPLDLAPVLMDWAKGTNLDAIPKDKRPMVAI